MVHRTIKIQLAVFAVIALLAGASFTLYYLKLPAVLFEVGRYTVKLELPRAAGLYEGANVTYRGAEVGRVQSVALTDTGVRADLSLRSDVAIPSDLKAEVHSQTAIGEQYVELLPHSAAAAPLKQDDVIPVAATSVPPDINDLVSAALTGLEAIPHDNLKTVIDESYTAVAGLGPELSRLVKNSSTLAIEARENLDPMLALIDRSKPVLDSQANSSEAIQAWASHVAAVTSELRDHDAAVKGVIDNAGPALGEARALIERLQPTLPILLANLVSVGQVAVTYQNDLEQVLVLLPQLMANQQGSMIANANTKQDYAGFYINLNLNLNVPSPCTTGYLPAQQIRNPVFTDAPSPPPGDLYCRVPQDSEIDVRGVRNIPCETRPGKRAATVRECESDEQYVPLNDGYNWKGDPNATLSGQPVPEPPAGTPAAPPSNPSIAVAQYDPTTGTYIGPDGKRYTQSDLGQTPAGENKSWQGMLLPPGS